ncbi:MAG: beta-propeller domain-containing protein, partial [Oscillospiraceae bacterium]|nr:beta-propeller domain-containing protein [Oscillospiraceae bacterium]
MSKESDKIINAVGEVGDDIVERTEKAEAYNSYKRKYKGLIALACCAVAAIVIVPLAFMLTNGSLKGGDGVPGVVSSDSAAVDTVDAEAGNGSQQAEELITDEQAQATALAANYDQVYEAIDSSRSRSSSMMAYGYATEDVAEAEEAEADGAAPAEAPAADVAMNASAKGNSAAQADTGSTVMTGEEGLGSGSDDYSGTNVQVKGIDEGDIVKTDGKYIYSITDTNLYVYKADGENSESLSITTVGSEKDSDEAPEGSGYRWYNEGSYKYPFEMYISGDKLVILSNFSQWLYYEMNDDEYHSENTQHMCIDIYDVSDPASPRLSKALGQDGWCLTSRLMDGKLYVISNYYVSGEIDKDEPVTFVPRNYEDDKIAAVDCASILLPGEIKDTSYTVINSYDLSSESLADSLSVLGGGSTVYMNYDNLYIASMSNKQETSEPYTDGIYSVVDYSYSSTTDIMRFGFKDGIELKAEAQLPGYLDSQFSMDEYDGHLRLVTTTSNSSYSIYTDKEKGFTNYVDGDSGSYNCLYVLDMDLNTVGSIENLAQDEYIYSARFDGEVGYFVTFRTTDPLFAVDLKDPANPTILSELKLPGFSDYLHVWDKGLLFGLGKEADEETGRTGNLKLSMFDTSDPRAVTELHCLPIDSYYSEALYNHKAMLIAPERNLIGFCCDDGRYYFFGYDRGDGFRELAVVDFDEWNYNTRGLY